MRQAIVLPLLFLGVVNIFYLLVFLPWFARKKKLNLGREPFSHLGSMADTSRSFSKILSMALILQYLFFLGLIQVIPVPMAAVFVLTVAAFSGIFPAFFSSKNSFWVYTIFGLTAIFGSFIGGLIINLHSPVKSIGLVANFIMLIGFIYSYYKKFIDRTARDFNCVGELIIFSGISLWNLIYFLYAISKLLYG